MIEVASETMMSITMETPIIFQTYNIIDTSSNNTPFIDTRQHLHFYVKRNKSLPQLQNSKKAVVLPEVHTNFEQYQMHFD
jgi:hypothetical protein